jgi:hypothetical protein
MVSSSKTHSNDSHDVFLRIWNTQKLTTTLARHILKLDFPPADLDRMADLSERNREGKISQDELQELDRFLQASMTLSVLHLRAKRFLQKARVAERRG